MERSEIDPQEIFAPARGVAFETWQIAISRMPAWVFPPEGKPWRPRLAIYGSIDRELWGLVIEQEAGQSDSALVEKAVRRAVREWRSKPLRIEAAEAGLVPILESLLAGTGVAVEQGHDLYPLRRAEAHLLARFEEDETSPPGLLAGNVTLAQIAAFVHAAGEFLAAAPWNLLGPQDLLQIETPEDIDPELRWVNLTETRTDVLVTFFRNQDEWDEAGPLGFQEEESDAGPRWLLMMTPRWELSANDTDLWDRHHLPTYGDNELCPVPFLVDGDEVRRPDARQLADLEGLLRTLAASTGQDIDAGRWHKEVATHSGRRRFVLSFPGLLDLAEDLANRTQGDADPEDQIGGLLAAAQDLGGRRAILLARHALSLQPDSPEAWLELADATPDPAQALDLFRRALDLSSLRLEAAEVEVDDLDAELSPPTPLRAHTGMARALSALNRKTEAVTHLFEAYRLDPGDFLESQDELACLLVELGRDGEAQVLLDGNEGLDGPAYTQALIAFRREGDSPGARRALRAAWRQNASIPSALLPHQTRDFPESSSTWDMAEALAYANVAASAWRSTPGALTWLDRHTDEPAEARSPGSGKKNKGRKGQRKKKKKRR